MAEMSRADPIFVVGCPKSGTTMVSQMLSNHPDIELDFDHYVAWKFLVFYEKIMVDPGSLMEIGAVNTVMTNLIMGEGLANPSREYFASLHTGYSNGKRWGNSAKPLAYHIPVLTEWFPDACFVPILRDPRDNWCSYRLGHLYPDQKQTLEAFLDTYMGYYRIITGSGLSFIRYEDIISSPELVYERVGVEKPSNPASGLAQILRSRSFLPNKRPARDDIVRDSIGRYRNELSSMEIDQIERATSGVMERYYR